MKACKKMLAAARNERDQLALEGKKLLACRKRVIELQHGEAADCHCDVPVDADGTQGAAGHLTHGDSDATALLSDLRQQLASATAEVDYLRSLLDLQQQQQPGAEAEGDAGAGAGVGANGQGGRTAATNAGVGSSSADPTAPQPSQPAPQADAAAGSAAPAAAAAAAAPTQEQQQPTPKNIKACKMQLLACNNKVSAVERDLAKANGRHNACQNAPKVGAVPRAYKHAYSAVHKWVGEHQHALTGLGNGTVLRLQVDTGTIVQEFQGLHLAPDSGPHGEPFNELHAKHLVDSVLLPHLSIVAKATHEAMMDSWQGALGLALAAAGSAVVGYIFAAATGASCSRCARRGGGPCVTFSYSCLLNQVIMPLVVLVVIVMFIFSMYTGAVDMYQKAIAKNAQVGDNKPVGCDDTALSMVGGFFKAAWHGLGIGSGANKVKQDCITWRQAKASDALYEINLFEVFSMALTKAVVSPAVALCGGVGKAIVAFTDNFSGTSQLIVTTCLCLYFLLRVLVHSVMQPLRMISSVQGWGFTMNMRGRDGSLAPVDQMASGIAMVRPAAPPPAAIAGSPPLAEATHEPAPARRKITSGPTGGHAPGTPRDSRDARRIHSHGDIRVQSDDDVDGDTGKLHKAGVPASAGPRGQHGPRGARLPGDGAAGRGAGSADPVGVGTTTSPSIRDDALKVQHGVTPGGGGAGL